MRRGRPATRRGSAALLSRDVELSALGRVLASAASGMGASLLLEGGIGAGKSHLVRAALRAARSRGFEVMFARALQAERALPYGLQQQVHDQLPGAVSPVCAAEAGGAAPGHAATLPTHRLVAELPARAPLLRVVDNPQWADAHSLHWFGRFMNSLEGRPVALVATLAWDHSEVKNADQRPVGTASLADVASEFHRREVLQGLNADSVGYLLASAFGEPLDTELVRACHEATGGNPLLVRALLREMRRSGIGPADLSAGRIAELGSAEVAEMLVARFEEWFPEVGRALDLIAVMNRVESSHVVAELVGIPSGVAADVLHTLVRCGVLDETPAGTGFSRPMIRTSFLTAMPPSERARLHAEAAKALHGMAAPRSEITAHLLRSAPVAEPWSCRLLIDMADNARAEGDLKRARACLERGSEECGPGEEPGLLRRLGHVELAEDPAAAVAVLHRTLGLAPEPDERRAVALVDLAQAICLTGDVAAALRVMENEVADFERASADKELSAGISAVSGLLTLLDGKSTQRTPATVLTEATAIPWIRRSRAALSAVCAQWDGERREEAVRHARLGLSEPVESVNAHAAVRLALLLVLSRAGEHEEAAKACGTILSKATAEGSGSVTALALAVLTECAFRTGRLQEAEDAGREALEYGPGRHWLGSAQARCRLGGTLLESGDLEGAQRLLLDDRPHTPDVLVPALLFHRGRLQVAVGRAEAGLADLEECGRQLRARGWSNPAAYPWRSEAALTYAHLGNHAVAERLLQEELELARGWGAPDAIGRALRVLGLLTRGDGRAAVLGEAVGFLRESGAALDEARALRDLGPRAAAHGHRPAGSGASACGHGNGREERRSCARP
ncbi:AAA family ATPase [Streptomyces iconiensis]|uniref:AAA family ATPase n=1 Tax=Streptomyces iconiensis TaxID=1384038 RepID=A0ABT6ZYM5_9ACTN|nr:ATP-binding protein [Streptomyces iconiensis]MDJ1134166.1 AAA family ATPase [Streptomyces iconiensis]